MAKKVKILSVLLLIGHLLTESHSILLEFYPNTIGIEMNLFLDPNCEMKINVLWYIKMLFDSLLMLVIFFVLAKVTKDISRNLFYISCCWFLYHTVDLFSFMWNYKETAEVYWAMLVSITCTIYFLIFSEDKTQLRAV